MNTQHRRLHGRFTHKVSPPKRGACDAHLYYYPPGTSGQGGATSCIYHKIEKPFPTQESAQAAAQRVEALLALHQGTCYENDPNKHERQCGIFHDTEHAQDTIHAFARFSCASDIGQMVQAMAQGLGLPATNVDLKEAREKLDPQGEWTKKTWDNMQSVVEVGQGHYLCIATPYGVPEVHAVHVGRNGPDESFSEGDDLTAGIREFMKTALAGHKLDSKAAALKETLYQGLEHHPVFLAPDQKTPVKAAGPSRPMTVSGEVKLQQFNR